MTTPRKCTVSEFIRESKPDWAPVRRQYRDASTGPFTGPLTVVVSQESFEDQIDAQVRQMTGETHSPVDAMQEVEEYVDYPESGVPSKGEGSCLPTGCDDPR